MQEIRTVYAPRIRVSGMSLARQTDGSYTANIVRAETTVAESVQTNGVWSSRAWTTPWDVRVDQGWLHMYPKAWEPEG